MKLFLIALTLGGDSRCVPLEAGDLVLSTHLDRENERVAGSVALRANEGVIVRLPHAPPR